MDGLNDLLLKSITELTSALSVVALAMKKKEENDLLLSVINYLHAWGFELPEEVKQRDEREPGREQKIRFENRLYRAVRAYFKRLAAKAQRQVETHEMFYPRKAIDLDEWIGADFFEDGEFDADIIRLLLVGVSEGADLFSRQIGLTLDYSGINKQALAWARRQSGLIVKTVDQATREQIRSSISLFVETPGFTVGDIMRMLQSDPGAPLSDVRALRIAVTETTRAYSKGSQIGAEQLEREFPEADVYEVWMTNNDDQVCELCRPLHGKEKKRGTQFYEHALDDPFQDGYPPRHVGCYCWIDYFMRLRE